MMHFQANPVKWQVTINIDVTHILTGSCNLNRLTFKSLFVIEQSLREYI